MAAPAADDCKLDVVTVASALGVQAAKANTFQGHRTLSPDNMDVFACSYAEATVDPQARVLSYTVYTPIAKDLASVYASVAHPNIRGNPQAFSPGVGSESTGWVRASANGATFDGGIVFRMPSYFVEMKVGMIPSAAAVQSALVSAGKALSKL
jgi:hypothetical protein